MPALRLHDAREVGVPMPRDRNVGAGGNALRGRLGFGARARTERGQGSSTSSQSARCSRGKVDKGSAEIAGVSGGQGKGG